MQRYRAVILIVLLGVVPVVAAFVAALWFLQDEAATSVAPVPAVAEAPSPPPATLIETRTVLAAARPLPVGTLLGEEDLTTTELEVPAVRRGHIVAGENSEELLRGFAVREPLAAGEALDRSAVVGPKQRGFLAAVLRPGTRAVTIRVGPATSHAGLVDPGDRVDVVLSAELQLAVQERAVLAGTIVEDVRVLAVDRLVGNGVEEPAGDEKLERTEIVTVTLEVTPEQGGRLVLGGHEGVLSLAVRSLADASPRVPESAVELRDLLQPSQRGESPAALAERLQAEIESLEVRLQEEEDEQLRQEEEGRLRMEEELALMEERLRAEMEAAAPPEDDGPEVKTVRVFRGSEPAQDVQFGQGQ